MLSPNDRESYSDALRPPPAYRFDEAIATTYTLDLTTLLTVPLHLALYSGDQPMEELLSDGIALLEALRKTSSRIGVYCQRGRIAAPEVPRALYSLLEPMVREARAPGSGSLHSKLWLLRFRHRNDHARPPRLRALVLTHNLTADRCWDLALSLEGEPGKEPRQANRDFAALLRALPGLTTGELDTTALDRAERLADEAHRCEWEIPGEYETVTFHALGLPGVPKDRGWRPPSNQRLVVISPFVTAPAIEALAATTSDAFALVSRIDQLAALDETARQRFARILVLDEGAEGEDGEDVAAAQRGLHAKAYVWYESWRTHVVTGSANATTAALVAGRNVELLAELAGKASRVGRPEDVVSPDHFGKVLVDYHPDASAAPDDQTERARARLEQAREALAAAALRLHCERREGETWRLVVSSETPFALPPLAGARVWPVTLAEKERAKDLAPLVAGGELVFQVNDVAFLTTFIAFELATADPEERIRFVVTLPAEGLPAAERDASIIRSIIRNRDGFVRYLLLLLATEGEDLGGTGVFQFGVGTGGMSPAGDPGDVPLLEEMTRAYCRDLPKLRSVRRLVEELSASEAYSDIIPPTFHEMWEAFEAAMAADAEEKGR